MQDALGIAGDVIQGGAALAGLMIVFIGNAVSGYSSYEKVQQRAVRAVFHQRAWFGFWGVFIAITAVVLAVFAKWSGSNELAIAAAFFLLSALAWAGVCAWSTAREVK